MSAQSKFDEVLANDTDGDKVRSIVADYIYSKLLEREINEVDEFMRLMSTRDVSIDSLVQAIGTSKPFKTVLTHRPILLDRLKLMISDWPQVSIDNLFRSIA